MSHLMWHNIIFGFKMYILIVKTYFRTEKSYALQCFKISICKCLDVAIFTVVQFESFKCV